MRHMAPAKKKSKMTLTLNKVEFQEVGRHTFRCVACDSGIVRLKKGVYQKASEHSEDCELFNVGRFFTRLKVYPGVSRRGEPSWFVDSSVFGLCHQSKRVKDAGHIQVRCGAKHCNCELTVNCLWTHGKCRCAAF